MKGGALPTPFVNLLIFRENPMERVLHTAPLPGVSR